MTDEPSLDDLLGGSLDLIVLSFPLDGSEAEKAMWLKQMRTEMERRAPGARANLRGFMREE